MRKSIFSTLDHHPDTGRTLKDAYEAMHLHAQLAEELGFEGLWVGEHHFHNVGSVPNPAVLLSSLARSTKNLRIGPAIAILPFRDVLETAENYAMVDILSGGRLNMGVGIGNSQAEFDRAKIDFENRRDLFESHLLELKKLWGMPYDVGLDSLNVETVQTPTPRIYVSTITAERAYRAGKEGDSVVTIVPPTSSDLSNLGAVAEAHARGLSESDVDTSNAELVATVYAHAADSEEVALQTAATSFARFMQAASGHDLPNPEALCQSMLSKNTAFIGTTEQISQQIMQYKNIGIEHLSFLCNFGGMTSEQVTQSITYLGNA